MSDAVSPSGWLRSLRPAKGDLKADVTAALPTAISSVPDGMAGASLIGVNPVFGLYATVFGPSAGGLFTSTSRMAIVTTTASSLAAGSALARFAGGERESALFLLTIIAGLVMVAAGLLRLGRYTRFVSSSVLVGFLTGVSVSLVLGQIGDLIGVTPEPGRPVAKVIDILGRLDEVSLATLGIGALTVLLLVILPRTPIGAYATVFAVAIPALVVFLANLDVAVVSDKGAIPRGLPLPALPDLGLLDADLVFSAAAIAVIVLVQGFGVSQSVPEPGRAPDDGNRDFVAQGLGNVASGFFSGQPVGGSVGQTAIVISSGGRSRWAVILTGVWMALILLALAPLIGAVAVPTLAAVLIVAGVQSIDPSGITSVWHTATISRVAMVVTFGATLALPIPAAVGLGIIVSLLLQLNQEASDFSVVELVQTEAGILERPAPKRLEANSVVLLQAHGSLYFAGARTLLARLPDPGSAQNASVVLRLRGRRQLGATALTALASYAGLLANNGGRLYLSGVSSEVMRQLTVTGVTVSGPLTAEPAGDLIGESTRLALDEAEAWMVHGGAIP